MRQTTKQLKILLIDDDVKMAGLLRDYLLMHDMQLFSESDSLQGLKKVKELSPDLLILDVMMPGKDGFALCRELRSAGSDVPIIMLTARGEVTDRVVGLELGADDYMPKPFEPRELVARIRSVARRGSSLPKNKSELIIFGDLEVDFFKRQASLKGVELDLTSTEFELLKLFVQAPGKKFSRDEIMNILSGVDANAFSRSIDILISRLRQKLGGKNEKQKYIKTVWGAGYVFVMERVK